jgi:hypothetical protein
MARITDEQVEISDVTAGVSAPKEKEGVVGEILDGVVEVAGGILEIAGGFLDFFS